jgi:hypothetical protein
MKIFKISLLLFCALSITDTTAAGRKKGGRSFLPKPLRSLVRAAATTKVDQSAQKEAELSNEEAYDYRAVAYAVSGWPSVAEADKAAVRRKLLANSDRSTSPSELPTKFSGTLPDIAVVHGGYVPARYNSWNFPSVSSAASDGTAIDPRTAAKAGSELYDNPLRFDPIKGAQVAIALKEQTAAMGTAYWGDYNAACRRAKNEEAAGIVAQLREGLARLRILKSGEKAALEGYGRVNGTGRTSPVALYGMGSRFSDDKAGEVRAAQTAIAQAFAITHAAEKAQRDVIAAREAEVAARLTAAAAAKDAAERATLAKIQQGELAKQQAADTTTAEELRKRQADAVAEGHDTA